MAPARSSSSRGRSTCPSMAGISDDLRNLPLDGMLIHSWLDGDEVKLQFYFERQDGEFASIDLTVETEMGRRRASIAADYVLSDP